MAHTDRPRSARPTSADVAREAAVSRATVSYVLNEVDDQTISEPTRQAVLSAAQRLGYRPNLVARSLRKGRNQAVIFDVPPVRFPSSDGLMGELTACLAKRGITLLTHFESPRGSDLVELCRRFDPGVVLSLVPLPACVQRELRELGVRQVIAEEALRVMGEAAAQVGELQVAHLVDLGHRQLAYAQTGDSRLAAFSGPRQQGVMEAARRRGLPPVRRARVALDPSAARQVVRRWHLAGVTAACAYNDEVGHALLRGIQDAGLRCPEDVAVVGVDDMPIDAVSMPPLSSIAIVESTVASLLVEALLRALGIDPEPRGPIELPFRLRVRASTAGLHRGA